MRKEFYILSAILMVIGVLSVVILLKKETSYTLHIKTEPAGAQISIVEPAMPYRAGMAVAPGRYQVKVEAPGYETREQWIEVTDRNIEATVILEEVKYALHIEPTPSNAEVRIIEPAMTYTSGVKVKPGRYLIQVQLEGYDTRDEWISVTSQDVETSIALEKSIIIQNHPKYAKLGYGGVDLSDDATQEQEWLMTKDKETGLIWEVKTLVKKDDRYNWNDAQSVFIGRINNQRLGGFDDWRLPSKDELESLLLKGERPAVAMGWFPNTVLSVYWSATTNANHTSNAWVVNFSNGVVDYYSKSSSYYVRAVRAEK